MPGHLRPCIPLEIVHQRLVHRDFLNSQESTLWSQGIQAEAQLSNSPVGLQMLPSGLHASPGPIGSILRSEDGHLCVLSIPKPKRGETPIIRRHCHRSQRYCRCLSLLSQVFLQRSLQQATCPEYRQLYLKPFFDRQTRHPGYDRLDKLEPSFRSL